MDSLLDENRSAFILKTKISIPPALRQEVERSALLERLSQGADRALTVLSAPAGFGKTTLLSGWTARSGQKAGWVSLDADDNLPVRFLTYLAASLHSIKQISAETFDAIRTGQNLPPRTMLVLILQELEAAGEPFWLILDDYHLITERAVHELLQYLLEHFPSTMHLIIATRADLPIPLARMRSRGQLFELRAADLRFTEQEIALFLNQRMGLNLTMDEVRTLESRTEGWIAGLQMAALALQGEPDNARKSAFLAAFSGSHRFVLDYLMEEVILRQPEDVQEFLLRTSVLDSFCAGLCSEVIQASAGESSPAIYSDEWSRQTLALLERGNLFLFPLDEERRWYRYHHLFGDLLRARLMQTQPELVPEIHRRAAVWYERNGDPLNAIRHAFRAGRHDLAANLLEANGQERWSQSDTVFLLLVRQLPPHILVKRPVLGILHAWTSIIFGQLQVAEPLLGQILAKLDKTEPTEENRALRTFVRLLVVYLAEMSGQTVSSELPAAGALDAIPTSLLGMRNTADVILAMLYSTRGKYHTAEAVLRETVRRDIAAAGTTAVPISISIIARNFTDQGRLREAERLCLEYIHYVDRAGAWRFYLAGNLHLALGEVLLEWNRLEEAERAILDGITLNEPWNIPSADASGAAGLARLRLAQGKLGDAQQAVWQGLKQAGERFVMPETLNDLHAIQTRLWIAAGNHEAARPWLESQPTSPEIDPRRERNLILLAEYRVFRREFYDALALFDSLEVSARDGGRVTNLLRILALKAVALNLTGDRPGAFAALEKCLETAEPEGFLRVFINLGEPLRLLVTGYLQEKEPSQAEPARRVLAAFGGSQPVHGRSDQPGLVELLSTRELEVLGLLCEGLANQEIAARLFITVSAVKKHTGNIFGKLGVTSRTQAVVRAGELGLIPRA